MVVDDGERQPLLSNQRGGAVKEESWLSSCISTIRSSWSVYQIVLLLLVYQISYYGQVAATFDIVRDLTCARHYERNPDLIDPSDDDPCSSDLIESQSARILLIFELLFGLGSAFATIHFGKKLSTWGRKPILIISLFTLILYPLACIVVPRGYPYGPVASEAIITPSTSITILGVVSAATGLLGGAALPMCCFRLLVVDHSDTADRTKNLGFVMVSYLVGIMIGPLISAVGSYVLPIYARGVDGALISIVHRLFRSHLDTVSNMTIRQSEHGNVTPFIICVFGGIFSIIYVILFVKETAFSSRPAAEVGSEENDPTPVSHTEAKPSKLPITPLRAIIPIKQKDGTYDMRITALFLTMVLVLCASSGLEIIILFFGHGMHWAASSVGYLISSLGATRLVTMSLLLPSLLVLLERRVRRPGIIAQYTVEELHKISKGSTSEETPVDASAFASEANLDETRLQQGAISLWRAKIDRYIVLVSWGAEVIGWLVIAVGATLHTSAILLIGNVIIGFGVGGMPALQSFGLTVTSDVLAGAARADRPDGDEEDEEDDTAHHGHAGEIFFSLLSFAESVVTTGMPILNNLVYSATLTSFPAACFIISSSLYLAALTTLSTVAIHRQRSTR